LYRGTVARLFALHALCDRQLLVDNCVPSLISCVLGNFLDSFCIYFYSISCDLLFKIDAARKFKAIQTWWQDMADRNCTMQPVVSILQTSRTIESNTAIRRGKN
jgi:hypothetical protein